MTRSSTHEPYLQAVPVAAFVVDRDGRISAWNSVAEDLFGWSDVEVLGDSPPCVPSTERGRWREALESALASGSQERGDVSTPFSLRTVDGRRIEASVSLSSVSDSAVFVSVEDDTRHRALSQELQLYNRVLRHNLRNDLNLVMGYADELAEHVEGDHAMGLVDGVRENAETVLELAETARDLDVALGDSAPLEVMQLDVVVDSVLSEYRDVAGASVSSDLQSVRVRAAPHVSLGIKHLVDNAVSHSEGPDASVHVSVDAVVRDGRRWATVVVEDDGPGIPKAEREVLTQGSETQLRHGSGLGLWLVYWVVRQSNGELAYESTESSGSRVVVRLLSEDTGPAGSMERN